MSDKVIRATACDSYIRAFAADVTESAETARTLHGTSPVMSAALGRLLAAGAMMGTMMKGEDDLLTLSIRGDGPGKGVTVTSDSKGNIKGYAIVPDAEVPSKIPGKLNVGDAIGEGFLSVSMDLGLKEPYNGTCELQSGEIGDDLAYYFTVSEQTPSAVGLGVKVETDCSVSRAGGFIVQIMPDAPEDAISALEEKLKGITHVTKLMDEGKDPAQILELLLGDLDLNITDQEEVRFNCNCSHDRVLGTLATISEADIKEMVESGEEVEVVCQFCSSKYKIGTEELKEILEQRSKKD